MLRKSGFIKWSCWRRTAKPLTPVKSTCFTVCIPSNVSPVRLQKLTGISKNHVLYLLGLRPRKASGAARPPLSFRCCCGLRGVLRTQQLNVFIKWSCWRRTAKRLTPVESTRFEVSIASTVSPVRLQKLTVMSKN